MSKSELIQIILEGWENVMEEPYSEYQGEERYRYLEEEGFNPDDIVKACELIR